MSPTAKSALSFNSAPGRPSSTCSDRTTRGSADSRRQRAQVGSGDLGGHDTGEWRGPGPGGCCLAKRPAHPLRCELDPRSPLCCQSHKDLDGGRTSAFAGTFPPLPRSPGKVPFRLLVLAKLAKPSGRQQQLRRRRESRRSFRSFIKSRFIDKIEYLYLFLQGSPLHFLQKKCTRCISLDIYIWYTFLFFVFAFYNVTNNYINTSSNVRNPYLLGLGD